jgi:hypothetical protein
LVVVLDLVDFFGAAFVVVRLVGLAIDLLVVFDEVLLIVFAAGFVAALLADFALAAAGFIVAADASMSGLVFFGGAVARTCLIALACCSSVTRNS